ncbi:MAG: hypothetical protein Q9163_006135, partial [Psora crenata]
TTGLVKEISSWVCAVGAVGAVRAVDIEQVLGQSNLAGPGLDEEGALGLPQLVQEQRLGDLAVVPAQAGDGPSPDRSAYQEPNARGIPGAPWNQAFADNPQVRQRLAIAHNLRKDKKKKPVLHAEDEFELLKTLYISIETTFPQERYRVQLGGICQLAGITGNRPGALLGVLYRHVKVTLLPDPDGGEQPRVLIEIVFPNTKGYLGEKDPNEFGIPDDPNKPCLLLCQITVLALLFADRAFAASSLTSPERLLCLRIPLGQKQLPLPLKEELAEIPLFRRCKITVRGIKISGGEALTDSTLRRQMTNLGNITGMELPTGLYTFRRGNGQALDNSSEITHAQRNIILQYYSSSIFQKSYASRYIPDTQAAYRGLKPQTALMRAAGGISRTIDPQRPRRLNLAQ